MGLMGQLRPIVLIGFIKLMGLIGLIGLISLIGPIGLIELPLLKREFVKPVSQLFCLRLPYSKLNGACVVVIL